MGGFRQTFPAAKLSLERGTGNVPDDGKYYLMLDGKVVGSFRSERQAQAKYQELRKAHVAEHPIERNKVDLTEVMRRDTESMSNKQLLWGPEDYAQHDHKTKKIHRA